jgi:hypothetical protein
MEKGLEMPDITGGRPFVLPRLSINGRLAT